MDRAPLDRGSSDRGSSDRGLSDRGLSDRGSSDCAPLDREAFDRGAFDRGSSDRAQEEYVALPPGRHALVGIPGGGKTSTLLRRVARVVRDGLLPADGFLLLTFSKDAAGELIRAGAKYTLPPEGEPLFTRDNTSTMHALGRRVVKGLDAVSEFVKTNVSTYVFALNDALTTEEGRAAARAEFVNVRAMFVDEAQDLNAPQHDAIVRLAEALGVEWVEMIGDPDQTIYAGMQQSSARYLLEERGGTTVRLTSNFRSTAAIVAFANALRPSDVAPEDAMVAAREAREGPAPLAVAAGGPDANVGALVRRICEMRDAGTPLGDIVVLGPVKKTTNEKGGIRNAGLTLVANALDQAGVPFAVHFDEVGEGEDDSNRDAATIVPGRVSLLTIHGSKGLAWPHVMVVNFNRHPQGFNKTDRAGAAEADRLLYVAATRARETLTVFMNTGVMGVLKYKATQAQWEPPRRMPPEYWPAGYAAPALAPDGKEGGEAERPLERDLPVLKFIGAVLKRDAGAMEYTALRALSDGLTMSLVRTFPGKPEWRDVDRNDYALLGSAAELLTMRAATHPDDFLAGLRDPRHVPSRHADPNLYEVHDDHAAYLDPFADDPVRMVWKHVAYKHQLKNETRYRRRDEYGRETANVKRLQKMLPFLEAQGRAFRTVLGADPCFQVGFTRCLPLSDDPVYHGVVDVLGRDNPPTFCELKLSKDRFRFKSVLQLLLYAHTTFTPAVRPRLLLWNLELGTVHEVGHDWERMEAWLHEVEGWLKPRGV